MKVIGINGSPHANGNTRLALDIMGKAFKDEGIDFEILHVRKDLAPCTGCFRCAKTHRCVLPDDGLNALYETMIQADALVFAPQSILPPSPAGCAVLWIALAAST